VAILDALRDLLVAQRRRLLSKNALARAIQYALTARMRWRRYASDGRLAIDNNVGERALGGVAITRKNFLSLGSELRWPARRHTVLETGKLNGLDPEAYRADVINHMVGGHPINRLSELVPSNWHASSKRDPPASIRSHERRLTARSAAADNRLAVEAQIRSLRSNPLRLEMQPSLTLYWL